MNIFSLTRNWTQKSWKAPLGNGTNDTVYAGGRIDPGDSTLYLGTKKMRKARPIDSPYETALCAVSLRDKGNGEPLAPEMTVYKKVGASPRPTYLSYGTEWAGKFLTVVGSFAIFIAMINLMLFHGKRSTRAPSITTRRSGRRSFPAAERQ